MPTNRTRRTRSGTGADGLTEAAYQYFSFGPFFEGEEWALGKTEGEIETFWKAHRETIMDRFMADLRRKGKGWEGHRPEFYWKELKEPRLPVDMSSWPENKLYDPKIIGAGGLEADYAYLKRLGLLEEWEK